MFTRVAIVNRGEAAMRFIHAAREFACPEGGRLHTIALFGDGDRQAKFAREADEAVPIASSKANPYLDHEQLERSLSTSRAEAVWAGWGAIAEDPALAELCEGLGLVFIGPQAKVMRRLVDRIEARRLAESAGVPVGVWSCGPVDTLAEAGSWAATIGYPLVIKAAAGTGSRWVDNREQLARKFDAARNEAGRTFGDDRVFLEQVVTDAHQVGVAIIADSHGAVWATGVTERVAQRRGQVLIDEAPSPVLTDGQHEQLRAAAVRLAGGAGFSSAGTVEFLCRPDEDRVFFRRFRTSLPAEHAVMELTTGLDMVKVQLHVAGGGRLDGVAPDSRGHAIEVRLRAEDPEGGFVPTAGTLERLVWPLGPGVRVQAAVAEGDVIGAEGDPTIAKMSAWGRDREEARARIRQALLDTTALVRGGATNKRFLYDLLDHPAVVDATTAAGWLDRMLANGQHCFPERPEVALIAAAIDTYDAMTEVERNGFYTAAARGRPRAGHEVGQVVGLRLGGTACRLRVSRTGPRRYRLSIGETHVDVEVERIGPVERRLKVGRQRFKVVLTAEKAEVFVEVDGVPHRVCREEGGIVAAPGPGVIVEVTVAVGDTVDAGARVAVMETMKMELAIRAPNAGRIGELLVAPNTQVDGGSPLVRLEALEGPWRAPALAGFEDLAAGTREPETAAARCLRDLEALRSLILGFDFSIAYAALVVSDYQRDREALPADDADLLYAEMDIVTIFSDLCVLSRNRRVDQEHERDDEAAHNPREYFFAYLQTLDPGRAGLPESFKGKLLDALRHYEVVGLDRTPRLERSLYWMYLAWQRAPSQVPAVVAILHRWLQHPDAAAGPLRERLLATIERLIMATQLRHPVVGDLARSVRYECFDRPLINAGRSRVMQAMAEHLAALAGQSNGLDRRDRVAKLVECPEPLIELMAELDDDAGQRRVLIEVLTRRYYQVRSLTHVTTFSRGGRGYVTAGYLDSDVEVGVVACDLTADELLSSSALLAEIVAQAAETPAVVVDLYVRWTHAAPAPDAMAEQMGQALRQGGVPARVLRATLSVTTPGSLGVHRFTFEAGRAGLMENCALRDLHPMIAERLQVWRLANFDVTRLPSPDHVYLFHAVARSAPTDERLLALAEVRDLTPLRDATGALVALPELERVLAGCLHALRNALAKRPAGKRPQWNRVLLYTWPAIDIPTDEMVRIIRTLAPMTDGLELEQVILHGRGAGAPDGNLEEIVIRVSHPPGTGLTVAVTDPPTGPMKPIDAYTQKVLQARRRGTVYPYELIPLLLRSRVEPPPRDRVGQFVEYDLDGEGRLLPVDRPYGCNTSAIVVGTVTTPTTRYPEGMTRVALFGDPTKALGSLSEPECHRIFLALELAGHLGAPVEWFAISAGAKIAMDSGTENMDWVSRVLRRIIEFTQDGGEINVVVTGINVGAQPYWNAEATMLMHTKGILIMTPDSAMVLTGKQALEYSGGVAADDNFGIGGYDTVMGPNGQAQYWAPDLVGAIDTLATHYKYTYVAAGERFPRPALTSDPVDRDVRTYPHRAEGSDFTTVGDIFALETNPDRKKPFHIRTVIRAAVDQDHQPLERWAEMGAAGTAVVQDACIGGYPVTVLGTESKPLPRPGLVPADGPNQWTAGTLFPGSSKKLARAINAASGSQPLVVLANLSGFDGSPDSLRHLQLEYGAEIGRAVVNFDGPIVFCVVSRYHGGAFVVFSATLNDNMEVAAIESSFASVIGGPPAAAVVFAGEVNARTDNDPRICALKDRIAEAGPTDVAALRTELDTVRRAVHTEKLGDVGDEFERIHSIERAKEVGSIHAIIPASRLRPYLVEALERGMGRARNQKRGS